GTHTRAASRHTITFHAKLVPSLSLVLSRRTSAIGLRASLGARCACPRGSTHNSGVRDVDFASAPPQDGHRLPRGRRVGCGVLPPVPRCVLSPCRLLVSSSAGRATSVEVGLTVFLITAQGEAVEDPRHSRTGQQALAKAQKRLARRQKGSKRREQARKV